MVDLLMNTIKAKRHVGDCYDKLYHAVYDFEEKWDKKGVEFTAAVDWKSKTTLYIIFHGNIPDEIIDEIVDEFKETFNVELDEIRRDTLLETGSRSFSSTSWRYVFYHVDRWKS